MYIETGILSRRTRGVVCIFFDALGYFVPLSGHMFSHLLCYLAGWSGLRNYFDDTGTVPVILLVIHVLFILSR